MKVEIELNWVKIAKLIAILVVGAIIGYAAALATLPPAGATGSIGEETNYLTTADLNRQDIQASILLSRFCEGLGLRSSVYWQRDAEGNVYGTPICLPQEQ